MYIDAVSGGGLYLDEATANLNDVRIRDNRATMNGGGIAGVRLALNVVGAGASFVANQAGESGGNILCFCTPFLSSTFFV